MNYSIDFTGMIKYNLEDSDLDLLIRYVGSRLFRLGLYNVITPPNTGTPYGMIRSVIEYHGGYIDLILQNIVASVYRQGNQNKQVRLGATPGGRQLVLVLV